MYIYTQLRGIGCIACHPEQPEEDSLLWEFPFTFGFHLMVVAPDDGSGLSLMRRERERERGGRARVAQGCPHGTVIKTPCFITFSRTRPRVRQPSPSPALSRALSPRFVERREAERERKEGGRPAATAGDTPDTRKITRHPVGNTQKDERENRRLARSSIPGISPQQFMYQGDEID
eukprot:scaffold202030_cov32-Tisochrysis_lutea.AAC.1